MAVREGYRYCRGGEHVSWPDVIILVPVEQRPALEGRIRTLGRLVPDPVTGCERLYRNGFSYALDLSGRILAEYEPDELDQVTALVGAPYAVHVSCQSMEAARTLLREVLPGVDGLVDTNHFEILPVSGFLGLLARHPEWDWRRRPSTELP
ncbi:hypothetical protein SGR_241 [Streptomyces griseus subsp. griseus NBRC 13350]|uniref:Uncharacterized protein n=1 Tax=Streptomyces griseus subsp. griseus (strain JCM 4626 / CBS 651.72 / NBRC 13350 / KCC S-0626 / ISP 5235) TaxID=455632 RepID=B1VNP7_STRGG|nr:hypothetical protein SGR_241 [Streptomyces griseus subsp. griseus NBRC 13350]